MAINEKVNIEIESKTKGDGFKKVNKEINETGKSIDKTKESLIKFGTIAGGLAIAGITKFVSQSIILGKELKVLRDNFIGTSKDIDLFKKATAGTVSEGSLIKLSNYASDLGVSLKDQSLLFSLAEDAADKYGGGVEANFERVISATDGSEKGLRSVGIALEDYKQKVEEFERINKIKLDDLTAEEQVMQKLNIIYQLTGTNLDTVNSKLPDTVDSMDSLLTIAEDLVSAFGEGLINTIKLSDSEMQQATKNTRLMIDTAKEWGTWIGNVFLELGRGIEGIGKEIKNAIFVLEANIPFLKEVNDFLGIRDAVFKTKESGIDNIDRPFRTSDFSKKLEIKNSGFDLPPPTSKISGNTETKIKEDKEAIAKALLESIKVEILKGVTMPETLPGVSIRETLRDDYFGNLTQQEIQTMSNEGGFNQITQTLDYEALNQEAMNLNTNITNILSNLGIGTDNFVSKMFTGFNNILSLMQNFFNTIDVVQGIVGIVKAVGTVATATSGGGALISGNGGGNTNAYFRIDLNAMNIVREGSSQIDKYNNAIRVSI